MQLEKLKKRWGKLPVRVDDLVHESARGDALLKQRHRSFILSHLAGGCMAVPVFILYVLATGNLSVLTAGVFVWLATPAGIALFLSKTGRLEEAHFISALNLAGLVTFAMSLTGGIASFLAAWMIVVPVEGALSGNRRVVVMTIVIAVLCLAGLYLASDLGVLPPQQFLGFDPAFLAYFGAVTAAIYSGALAVSIQTVHRMSEDRLRQSEAHYRLLGENTTDLITRHDAQGAVMFASPAGRQIFGVEAGALLGEGVFQRVDPADHTIFANALRVAAREQVPVSVEFRVIRLDADGGSSRAWAEMRCRPVAANGAFGEHRGERRGECEVVAVTRDISERKAQEMQLRAALDQAESADRLKTQFLANVSHELRTPLNSVIGFAQVLERELREREDGARHRDYVAHIRQGGEQLLTQVNNILDMSKIEAGTYQLVCEPVAVAGLVAGACEGLANELEGKQMHIKVDVADNLPDLIADRSACQQMLEILIGNAVKFSEGGGVITVSAGRKSANIWISVADTGQGIAAQDLANVGRPFMQAETGYARKSEGIGLGLAKVKGLMGLHEGWVDIDSEPGRGTAVTLWFAGVQESGAAEQTVKRPAVGAKHKASTAA